MEGRITFRVKFSARNKFTGESCRGKSKRAERGGGGSRALRVAERRNERVRLNNASPGRWIPVNSAK